MADEPPDKTRARDARADTLPAAGPRAVVEAAKQARFTVSDTMPIAEVPEPLIPTEPRSGLPSGMHERGKLGRFDILDVLGQGGMGIVIAAYDPQLDRKVAIKVLRTQGLTGRRRDKEAARLLREARAMAQLSHPHVVTVYEAGEIDERVYIAMEYISGQTLRSWIEEQPRDVPAILDAFIKAGRGLAAGHQAGLVHRDFKPDNVLVGFDGRIRVIDFGLARPARQNDTPFPDESGEVSELDSARVTSSQLDARLTTVGSLFGTPIYMAPEQHQKIELDARADQFAFCVALYEALYNALPFKAESYVELANEVTAGRVRTPPTRADIPFRVVEAVMRGLSANPDARFGSMTELLDALAPPPPRRFGWLSLTLGAIAMIAIAVVVVLLVRGGGPAAATPCLDGPARMAGVWDAGVAAKVRAAFLATGRSHREETFRRVAAELDRYAARWIDDRRSICEATRVRHEQSEVAFDLRMQCTTDQLAGLEALVSQFATADGPVVDKAAVVVRELPDPARCRSLTSTVDPPTPQQAARISKLLVEYHQAKTLNLLGRYDRGAAQAQLTLDHAAGLDYPPFLIRPQHALGIALAGSSRFAEAEAALRTTLELAARAKDDRMTASAWIALITVIGANAKRYDEALGLEQVAEVAIQRADNLPTLRQELYYAIGQVSFLKGDGARAVEAFEAALRLPAGSIDEIALGTTQNALGAAYLRTGNIFGAKEAFEKSLARLRAALGDRHPDLGVTLSSLGGLAQAMGAWDEAIAHHEKALAIIEETRGPGHEQTGLLVYSLGVSRNGKEDFKAALPFYQRAAAIFEAISPTHPHLGLSLVGVADCLEEIGEAKAAVPIGERALELMRSSTDQIQLAVAQFILAKALWAAEIDRPRARKLARQAYAAFQKGGLPALTGLAAVDKWFKKIDGK